MKYDIDSNGQTFTVELQRQNGRSIAMINDDTVEFQASQPEAGTYLITLNNQVIEVRTVGDPALGAIDAVTQGRKMSLKISDPRRRRRGVLTITGKIEMKATMPGRVIRWLRQPGDEVLEGQGVLVLEAMKMQNEVRSPKAGFVKEISIDPGQTVEAGVVLAVIE